VKERKRKREKEKKKEREREKEKKRKREKKRKVQREKMEKKMRECFAPHPSSSLTLSHTYGRTDIPFEKLRKSKSNYLQMVGHELNKKKT
jgi:hypothetical protein